MTDQPRAPRSRSARRTPGPLTRFRQRPLKSRIAVVLLGISLLLFVRCAAAPQPGARAVPRNGYSIVVAGERFDIDTPVVLWSDPGGYSAYETKKRFTEDEQPDGKQRYGQRPGDPRTLEEVQEQVHAFVLHYDVAGTSRQCFKILQDLRTLSVHFMLDVDGTVYQTLDVKERAWHATSSNDFAVGVEIAHPGAYPQPMGAPMRRWYEKDERGWFMKYPKWMTETGIRTEGFVARPDRPGIQEGVINGRDAYQLDFTTAQYDALAKLCAGLSIALPRIELEAPRTATGELVQDKLSDEDLRSFDGIIGHFHVQTNKQDPGPAMQWERLLTAARLHQATWDPWR